MILAANTLLFPIFFFRFAIALIIPVRLDTIASPESSNERFATETENGGRGRKIESTATQMSVEVGTTFCSTMSRTGGGQTVSEVPRGEKEESQFAPPSQLAASSLSPQLFRRPWTPSRSCCWSRARPWPDGGAPSSTSRWSLNSRGTSSSPSSFDSRRCAPFVKDSSGEFPLDAMTSAGALILPLLSAFLGVGC